MIRTDILARYIKFYKSLLSCPSTEVNFLARLLKNDLRSSTGRNVSMLTDIVENDPWKLSRKNLISKLTENERVPTPEGEEWILNSIQDLWEELQSVKYDNQDPDTEATIIETLEALCTG